jgi:hypothetical protein
MAPSDESDALKSTAAPRLGVAAAESTPGSMSAIGGRVRCPAVQQHLHPPLGSRSLLFPTLGDDVSD